jgi:hypothetical protein
MRKIQDESKVYYLETLFFSLLLEYSYFASISTNHFVKPRKQDIKNQTPHILCWLIDLNVHIIS